MTIQTPPKINRQILEEASNWFVDFRVGDIDQQARELFDEWLRRSPEHIHAYMEIAKTYAVLPALRTNGEINVQELLEYARTDGNIVQFDHPTAAGGTTPARTESHAPVRRRGSHAWIPAIAASVVLGCIALGLYLKMTSGLHPAYATEIGERRSITLPDGSTISLNARSKITIEYSPSERDVHLLYGQALFEVAKDKARPFVVHSGMAAVRAVGTQFDVDRRQAGTTVTVIEGRVIVLKEGSATADESSRGPGNSGGLPPSSTYLSAGEQVVVTDKALGLPIQANVAAATAWLEHRLVFDASRLDDVVDNFNRYNAKQITIKDDALKEFHVSGVYSSTDPASLIRFLRAQPGVRVVETGDGVFVSRQ